jgi:hypothetical protein
MAKDIFQDMDGILVAIRGGELKNGKIHLVNLQSIILDHGVAQKFVASLVELLAGGFAIAVQFDFQIFADVNGSNARVAHVREGVLDGFALRIEHGLFWRDDNLCFHVCRVAPQIFPEVREKKMRGPKAFCKSKPGFGMRYATKRVEPAFFVERIKWPGISKS